MPRFKLIVASGHCGTKWLSKVLDAQASMRFYHELGPTMTQMAWFRLAKYPPEHTIYHDYWARIRKELKRCEVGDANSWAPWQIPAVARLIELDIIYLVRNGIQQLHSISRASKPWRTHSLDSPAFNMWLRELWQALGEPGPPYDKWNRWERLCLLIKANGRLPAWLQEHGLQVTAARLEDLIAQPETLQRLAPRLPASELCQWQERDINRKIKGDRRPSTLWHQWTGKQRRAFRRICGEEMVLLGYEIAKE